MNAPLPPTLSGTLSLAVFHVHGVPWWLDWHAVDTADAPNEHSVVEFSGAVALTELLQPAHVPRHTGDHAASGQWPHIAFAINCEGQAQHAPHLVRRGVPLLDQARGFYVAKGLNQVYAEHWLGNGTLANAWLGGPSAIATGLTSVAELDTEGLALLHFRICAGHRAGPMANRMALELRAGDADGPLLFRTEVPWGWDAGAPPARRVRCGIACISDPWSPPLVPQAAFALAAVLTG